MSKCGILQVWTAQGDFMQKNRHMGNREKGCRFRMETANKYLLTRQEAESMINHAGVYPLKL